MLRYSSAATSVPALAKIAERARQMMYDGVELLHIKVGFQLPAATACGHTSCKTERVSLSWSFTSTKGPLTRPLASEQLQHFGLVKSQDGHRSAVAMEWSRGIPFVGLASTFTGQFITDHVTLSPHLCIYGAQHLSWVGSDCSKATSGTLSNNERLVRFTLTHQAIVGQDKAKRLRAFTQTELDTLLNHLLRTRPALVKAINLTDNRIPDKSEVLIERSKLICSYSTVKPFTSCVARRSNRSRTLCLEV